MLEHLAICLQDTAQHDIYTQQQALEYLGSRLRLVKLYDTSKRGKTNVKSFSIKHILNYFCRLKKLEISLQVHFNYKILS